MIVPSHIDTLDPTQLRQALHSLMAKVAVKDEPIGRHERESAFKQAVIDKLTHNGHDPYVYLKNVLERLPNQPASRVQELLPHRWQPTTTAS